MNTSRFIAIALVPMGLATHALADEYARVLSSSAIVQAVSVPRQVCSQQQVVSQGGKTGAGAAIGAVAGGVIGNQIGHGSGRAAATAVGIVGGAVLGNHIEGGSQPQTSMVEQCSTQNVLENRVVGYNVQYEYAGKTYATQMAADPGTHVRLQIIPVGGTTITPPPQGDYTPPPPPPVYPAGPVTAPIR